jgi:hypothetical protein
VLTYDDEPLEALADADCRRLLATAHLGRLGFSDGALPAIVPVRFVLHEDSVLIPARSSIPPATGASGSVVVLQVDSFGDDLGPGWSVTAVGPSRVVRDPGVVAGLQALASFARLGGAGDCFISLRPGLLRGWRIGSLDAA